jgi:uncharacterized protein (TIGR03437 family)
MVSITSVVHAASFLPAAAPGAFVAIIGSGFGSPAGDWSDAIGSGGALPRELNGIQVRVGDQPAYVDYVSATQVNFLLPLNAVTGLASVQVTTPAGGFTATLAIEDIAPGLFAYQLAGTLYAAALFAGTATYVAATGSLPGYAAAPAQAGDAIELFGTGMGPTNPAAPDGVVFSGAYEAADLSAFTASIGGVPAQVLWAGMVAAGLYQVNVVVPAGLSGGNQTVIVWVDGQPVQANVMLTIQAG